MGEKEKGKGKKEEKMGDSRGLIKGKTWEVNGLVREKVLERWGRDGWKARREG